MGCTHAYIISRNFSVFITSRSIRDERDLTDTRGGWVWVTVLGGGVVTLHSAWVSIYCKSCTPWSPQPLINSLVRKKIMRWRLRPHTPVSMRWRIEIMRWRLRPHTPLSQRHGALKSCAGVWDRIRLSQRQFMRPQPLAYEDFPFWLPFCRRMRSHTPTKHSSWGVGIGTCVRVHASGHASGR